MFHKPLPGTVQVRYEAIRIRRRVVVLRWSVYIHLRRWYGDQHQYAVHFLYLSTGLGLSTLMLRLLLKLCWLQLVQSCRCTIMIVFVAAIRVVQRCSPYPHRHVTPALRHVAQSNGTVQIAAAGG